MQRFVPLCATAVLAFALAVASVLALTQPSQAAGARLDSARRVTLSVESSRVTSEQMLRFHATASHSPVGAIVKIERRVGRHWKVIAARRTTSSSGSVTATVGAPYIGKGVYRARALRTRHQPRVVSRLVTVTVDKAATTSLTVSAANVSAGQKVTLSGRSRPYTAGTEVTLQRYYAGRWESRATHRLSRSGRFSFTIIAAPGSHSYRAHVHRAAAAHIGPATSGEVHVSAPRDTATVSAGADYACSLSVDGAVTCWGKNDVGQLGIGTASDDDVDTPTALDTDLRFSDIGTGDGLTCGIGTDKKLWCWGEEFGPSPTQVGWDYQDWTSLSVGGDHVCAVRETGSMWCRGGSYGKTLARVGYDADWVSVATGAGTSCGIRDDTKYPTDDSDDEDPINYQRTLWCWDASLAPQQIAGQEWATVTVGTGFQCGTHEDGTLWCWGYNDLGQLGLGTTAADDDPPTTTPTQVGKHGNWQQVSAGDSHVCAIRGSGVSGSLWCWGYNVAGATATGDEVSIVVRPTQVRKTGDWQSVSAGESFTCGIDVDEDLSCWGLNDNSQLGPYAWSYR